MAVGGVLRHDVVGAGGGGRGLLGGGGGLLGDGDRAHRGERGDAHGAGGGAAQEGATAQGVL